MEGEAATEAEAAPSRASDTAPRVAPQRSQRPSAGPRRRLASMPAVSNVLLWPVRTIGAYLPDGWGGLARQLAIFIPFDIAYELSRSGRDRRRETALQHARDVVDAEQSLGIYQELARAALGARRARLRHGGGEVHLLPVPVHDHVRLRALGLRAQALRLHAAAQRPLRDVHARAARLHPLPDGAAADAARRGLRRSAAEQRRSTRAASSSRSSAIPTRPCRACTPPPRSSSARPACS